MNYAPVNITTLLNGVTATGAGQWMQLPGGAKTFHGHMTVTSGAGTATVAIEGTNNTGWIAQNLATLSLTDTADQSFTSNYASYLYYRANLTALTGTGAAVTANVGAAP